MSTENTLDPLRHRADFPILERKVHGKPLAYLDNAATTQKPDAVIDAIATFYRTEYANIHRGVHTLSEASTVAFEKARDKVAAFVGVPDRRAIVFTRNATEAINLVAWCWARHQISADDRVVVTEMEHHSNLVPWQRLAKEKGAELAFIPVTADGLLDVSALDRLLEGRVKLVALTQISNVLGTVNPIKEITARAHDAGAKVLVDGAQSVPHVSVDLQDLDVDFFAFSGHKMCGPTGIGVLYGKPDLLEAMPPFLSGGGMISRVGRDGATWADLPTKFEAGTPAIAEAVGLGAAIDYLDEVGMDAIWDHEHALVSLAMERLGEIPGVHIVGPPADQRSGVLAFTVKSVHPHDLAQILDSEGIAIRAGYHCAHPLHQRFEWPPTARASFYLYNTRDEVVRLAAGIRKAQEMLGSVRRGA